MNEPIDEDNLLKELGDLARQEDEAEQAVLDERWDRLAAGTLSAEEDAELRALAEASPEVREAYEAFRPLGADFQARAAAAAAAGLARGPAPQPAPHSEPPKPPARLLPFRPRVSRSLAWIGSVAAAAAVVFFVLRSPAAPLPVYTAELEGEARTIRGGEPGPPNGLPVFYPGSRLTLKARPEKGGQIAEPVEARAFLSSREGGGDLRLLGLVPEIAGNGAVRFQGRLAREIRIPPGLWTLWIVVGRAGEIPPTDELAAALRAGKTRSRGWQAISRDLRVDDRAPP